MTRMKISAFTVLVAGMLLIGCASAAYVSIGDGRIEVDKDSTATFDLILDQVPAGGMEGYQINLLIVDQRTGWEGGPSAQFTAITFNPALGGTTTSSGINSQSVDFAWTNTVNSVQPGETNILLATVTVSGVNGGRAVLHPDILFQLDGGGNTLVPDYSDVDVFTWAPPELAWLIGNNRPLIGEPVEFWEWQTMFTNTWYGVSYEEYPTDWVWYFGDGTTSTEPNPTHAYTEVGTYYAYPVVTTRLGTCPLIINPSNGMEVRVHEEPLNAAFTADKTSGTIPLTVQFTDESTGLPVSWIWDFNGDGNWDLWMDEEDWDQFPSYTYTSAGTYTVTHTIRDIFGHPYSETLTITGEAPTTVTTTTGVDTTLASSEGILTDVAGIANPSPGDMPTGVQLPIGLMEFTVEGVTTGGSTVVTIQLPEGITADTYLKYGKTPDNENPHWYEFLYDGETGAVINGNIITLHFIDGERGDDDISANGIVDDPGAPGLKITNIAPEVTVPADAKISEGDTFTGSGSFTDPDEDTWSATVDYGDDTGVQPLSFASDKSFSLSHTYKDEGVYHGAVVVNDGTVTKTATVDVTVVNVVPVVGVITAPATPLQVNTPFTARASFSDPGLSDTHTAHWNWGDGTTTVRENVDSGSVSDTHVFTTPGVYTIQLDVTDNDGATGTSVFTFVVVYDPSAGFVTGGGWIASPSGAYTPEDGSDDDLVGRANFGFVARYQKGAHIPAGNTEFRFKVADLTFKSTDYQYLVIAGARAQYKGSGTVNNEGDYGFILSAVDGQLNGGGGVDKFRIKIWEKATGIILYDNQVGLSEDAVPSTGIADGSIQIHP